MNKKISWASYKYQWLSGLIIIFLCLFIHLIFLVPGTKQGDFFKRLEGLAYDIRLQSTLTMHPKRSFLPIVIVDIDEKSIKQIGRFPWSREIVAELHLNLVNAGVSVIAYDVLFSEAEINPIKRVLEKTENEIIKHELSKIAANYDADHLFFTGACSK